MFCLYPKSNINLSSCTIMQSFMTPLVKWNWNSAAFTTAHQPCGIPSEATGLREPSRQPDFCQQRLSTASPHCRGWSEPVLPWTHCPQLKDQSTAGHRHHLQQLHWWYPWQPANNSGSHADTLHIKLVIRPTFSDGVYFSLSPIILYTRFKYLLDVITD